MLEHSGRNPYIAPFCKRIHLVQKTTCNSGYFFSHAILSVLSCFMFRHGHYHSISHNRCAPTDNELTFFMKVVMAEITWVIKVNFTSCFTFTRGESHLTKRLLNSEADKHKYNYL